MDLGSFIQLLMVIALSIATGIAINHVFYNSGLGFLTGVLTFLVLFIIFILSNYLFYLILGMHDSQESMAKSLEIISGREIQQTRIKKCLKCGTQYTGEELFCENCGNKLNQ